MKKILLIIISYFFIFEIYALDKIAEFENKKEENCFFIRKETELDPMEDSTGTGLKIDDSGYFFVIQSDMNILYKLNMKDYSLTKMHDTLFLEWACEGINTISDNYIFCSGLKGRFQILDRDYNIKSKIRLFDLGIDINTKNAYYNEENDVILFTDRNSNIHSIINPGLDDEQNKKNYRDPEQTKKLFSKNSEYGKKGLVIDDCKLYINNKIYFWGNANINNYQYLIGSMNIYVTNYYTDEEVLKYKIKTNDEQFESAAVHPSGDIYILRMNWNTNTHNLYRIENTWDPQWRAQWYKDHPDAN